MGLYGQQDFNTIDMMYITLWVIVMDNGIITLWAMGL